MAAGFGLAWLHREAYIPQVLVYAREVLASQIRAELRQAKLTTLAIRSALSESGHHQQEQAHNQIQEAIDG